MLIPLSIVRSDESILLHSTLCNSHSRYLKSTSRVKYHKRAISWTETTRLASPSVPLSTSALPHRRIRRVPMAFSRVSLVLLALTATICGQSLNTSDTAPGPFPTGGDQIQLSPPAGYPGANRDGIPRVNLANLTAAAISKLSVSRSTLSVSLCSVVKYNGIVHCLLRIPSPDTSAELDISPSAIFGSMPKGVLSGFKYVASKADRFPIDFERRQHCDSRQYCLHCAEHDLFPFAVFE